MTILEILHLNKWFHLAAQVGYCIEIQDKSFLIIF